MSLASLRLRSLSRRAKTTDSGELGCSGTVRLRRLVVLFPVLALLAASAGAGSKKLSSDIFRELSPDLIPALEVGNLELERTIVLVSEPDTLIPHRMTSTQIIKVKVMEQGTRKAA